MDLLDLQDAIIDTTKSPLDCLQIVFQCIKAYQIMKWFLLKLIPTIRQEQNRKFSEFTVLYRSTESGTSYSKEPLLAFCQHNCTPEELELIESLLLGAQGNLPEKDFKILKSIEQNVTTASCKDYRTTVTCYYKQKVSQWIGSFGSTQCMKQVDFEELTFNSITKAQPLSAIPDAVPRHDSRQPWVYELNDEIIYDLFSGEIGDKNNKWYKLNSKMILLPSSEEQSIHRFEYLLVHSLECAKDGQYGNACETLG